MMTRRSPSELRPQGAEDRPNSGRPRVGALFREALASARSQVVTTVVAAVVVAVVCGVVFATTGRSAATEQTVLSSVDLAGTRLITVSDNDGASLLSPQSIGSIASLHGVEWVIGLGPVTDMYPASRPISGTGTSTRHVYGDLLSAVDLVEGRVPGLGTAVMGVEAEVELGLVDGVGGIRPSGSTAESVAVVGAFRSPVVASLDTNVLVPSDPKDGGELRYIYVQSTTVEGVERLQAAVGDVLVAGNPASITVSAPQGLIELRDSIASGLGVQSRLQMLLILGVGLVLVSITMLGGVASRRKDFGRRRALGASRSAIVFVVVVQATVAGCVGVVLGSAVGLTATRALAGSLPSITFVSGVILLTLTSVVVAALPPALAAAYRDPVLILRVP